jgi:hypothetical protein
MVRSRIAVGGILSSNIPAIHDERSRSGPTLDHDRGGSHL